MGKVLIMIRTSTENQSIEDQHKEMTEFCRQRGYKDEDMIFIEEQGASAAKVDERYKAQIQAIKDAIEKDKSINCFACWHLNRAFRTEEAYIDIKNFMVPRKIQMLVKNPSLELLNPDGTVNSGMELAMALFAVLAKQDNDERKAKFHRAKKAYAKQGKYSGGTNKKFGYAVDENKFFIEDKKQSEIVKLIFQLYSTGQYSDATLTKEINSRGYTRDGKPFQNKFISHILRSKQYTGLPDEEYNMRVYPPLISVELFETCKNISENNRKAVRLGKKMVLCSKLVKCSECGSVSTSSGSHFRCCSYKVKCDNSLAIKENVVNEIAWRVAFDEHMKYLIEVSENNTQEYKERLEVIDQKINTINATIADSDTKKKRIVDTYLEGYIDKKERDLRLSKLQDDILVHQKNLSALNEEKSAILGLLENVNKEKDEWLYFDTLDAMNSSVQSDDDRYRIIHQHILKIIPSRYQQGEKAKDATRDNGIAIDIYTVKGEVKKHLYLPMAKKGYNLLTYHEDKELWIGERLKH